MTANFVLRGVRVLDDSGGFGDRTDVLVVDGIVVGIKRGLIAPDAADHDFTDVFLMAGIFDCHTHVALSLHPNAEAHGVPVTEWTLEAARNIRATLECGVTSVRDAGGADAGMRAAIDRGLIDGPRLQISINMLSETGGHGDRYLPGAEVPSSLGPTWPGRPPSIVDGPSEMRKVVRQLLRAGADWIKVCTTGGVLSPHDSSELPQFTRSELRAAVGEARRKGKAVMAHAFGGKGLSNAVSAGVKSIEHGLFLSESQAREMSEAGCWLVPTLAITHDVVKRAEAAVSKGSSQLPSYAISKSLELKSIVGEAVRIAKSEGVKIALGSDYFFHDQHGRNLEELYYLSQAGLTAEETLLAATIRGAELCGVADRLGRLAVGYVFDAIALDHDPTDLSIFLQPGAVRGVFKAGVAIVPHERLAVAS